MPSPPNSSERLSTFNASKELLASYNASPLSLNTKSKKNKVATKIQALFRGHNTRRKVKASKKKKQSRIRRALAQIDAPLHNLGIIMSTSSRTLRSSRKNK